MNPNLVKIDPSVFAQDFINTLRLLTSAPTGHIGQLGCPDSPNSYFDKSLLESYVDLPFEDGLFMAPAQYTDFLKAVYGDTYMQLPPKRKELPTYIVLPVSIPYRLLLKIISVVL